MNQVSSQRSSVLLQHFAIGTVLDMRTEEVNQAGRTSGTGVGLPRTGEEEQEEH